MVGKQTGLGDNLYVAGYDVSGDIGSLSRIGGGPAAQEMTGIDKLGFERVGGLRDGSIEFTSFFNPSSNQEHARFKLLPRTDVNCLYCRGTTLGNRSAVVIAKQINYDPSRGADGSLSMGIQMMGNGYGLEWGRLLTAGKRTDGGAAAGTSVDFGVGSTSFGLQAHLQVFAFTGTDATIKVQSSTDNGVGDAFADVTGGGFASVTTGPQAQRIQTTRNLTVERYLRVTTTTTSGFTNLVFAVMVNRNDVSTIFSS